MANKIKFHQCKSCEKTFTHSQTLNNHMKMIHDHEHKCEFCVMTFSESLFLKEHIKSVHKEQNLNSEPLIAKLSMHEDKIVRSVGDLSQIDFKCDLCEDSFVCSQDLKWHMDNIHEDLKAAVKNDEQIHKAEEISSSYLKKSVNNMWTCHTCGKNYTQAHNLKLHIRTVHEEVKQYNQLYLNTFIHPKTNKMMYKCDSCDKSYTQPHTLKNHIKVMHEGVKPFLCNFCDKSFTQSHNLRGHMKKTHHTS